MSAVALCQILHQGRVIEPGSVLPADIDAERLIRNGRAELVPDKPKRTPKPKADA